jgi:Na+-transporting methylmalonyl-CoA/oxaloacetate decarboxylase gamma subunit
LVVAGFVLLAVFLLLLVLAAMSACHRRTSGPPDPT